jgi:succinate-semialdehyde dehydrogenase/glutarate-semialdehyde dehydrogenase
MNLIAFLIMPRPMRTPVNSVSPHSGEILAEYQVYTDNQIETKLNNTHTAFNSWSELSYQERATFWQQMSELLKERKHKLGMLMSLEMGKPITQAVAEVEKCAWVCEHYAQNTEAFLQAESIETEFKKSYVRFDPIGVILAVMPWNFPLWQVFRVAAPQMMAGNTILLKHASNVSGCALEIEKLFTEVGFPEGVFQTILVPGSKVKDIIADTRVRAVTLTGSEVAGKSVASAAGKYLKKSLLELGGSDAYLVLEDADLDLAARETVTSRMINNGQSCIAAKRFLVHEKVASDYTEKVVKLMSEYSNADPKEDSCKLGPLARVDLKDELHAQVQQALKGGAQVLLGGQDLHRQAHYPATVLTNIDTQNVAFNEELFGPVASIISFRDEKVAVQMANMSRFGLGGAIFSKDTERAERLAAKMDTGAVAINSFLKSDPRLPFGGVKSSGYGRELGHHTLKEFTNLKTITVS